MFINPDGTIASRVAAGDTAIREFIETFRTESANGEVSFIASGNGHKLGHEVPEFELLDANGKEFNSKDLNGKKTLLTYWNNGCGYCQRMLDDLREWDITKDSNEINLLLLSQGAAETNLALDLKSTIVLDNDGKVAVTLGMSGTPSAILINEKGKIISEVAVGADQIWTLIGKKK